MSNQQISKLFKDVAAAYSIKNEKKYYFQMIAYQKASEAVEGLTSELKDLYKEKKLESVPGIGPTIRLRLEELFKKGHVKHFDWVLKGIPKGVFALIDIPTIGPKKAYKLAVEFSLNSEETAIEDLLTVAKAGKIAKLPTFGEKSQEDIQRALMEYKEGKGKAKRMVLPFAAELAGKLVSYLLKSKSISEATPLGSLRRMKPTVGDIDIAVASDNPKEAIKHFISYPYKERIIEEGPSTASILTSGGKQVDLMVQPKMGFGSLLQHFTGSKNHNVHLREYALKKKLSLSERGIKDLKDKKSKIKQFDKEEKFYNALGLDWIPPEMREDTGEIELSMAHKLPKIIELSDIKGDLHVHSNFPIEPSHDLGKNSIEEMVKKARELKYEYIGFSEHNPSVSKHNQKEIYDLISRRNVIIEQLNSENKDIRILKMLEVDILSNGKLAIDGKCLDLSDCVIVSIHSAFSMNKKTMTERVIKGLSHPKARILAHPTGRLLNDRTGYDLDFEKIFDFCKKNNKVLEINAWPTRLDLPDSLIRAAVEKGVKLIIDTDSHALWQMGLMKYGVAMARRGWAKKDDILNTLGYNDFIKWLKS
ncbi:MAG: hypothetical protein HYT07_03100 [Candidatus Levybacteria bacterium]|nr:hypothetical protein [Candidatus Levybacteria bacterium]